LSHAEETRLRLEREEIERIKEFARWDEIKAGATLLGAAVNAKRFLIENGYCNSDVVFELECAIKKETQQKEAA